MEINIRFGKPNKYDYDTLIDQFSGTKINSIKTSSVPLVQFWKNPELRLGQLIQKIQIDLENPILCFEYPTQSKGRGKSSMTDLMIISENNKIAIEAKYTEYLKKNIKTELIKEWRISKNKDNRNTVLNHWTNLIKPFSNRLEDNSIENIEYQFYHRTASACFESKKALVFYQLFYDSSSKYDLDKYINSIRTYINLINPNNNLEFYLWTVETKLLFAKNSEFDPFLKMKNKDIYKFGNDEIIRI